MYNFEHNSSVEIFVSAQTELSLNSDPRYIDVKFDEVETFITNQENSNTKMISEM